MMIREFENILAVLGQQDRWYRDDGVVTSARNRVNKDLIDKLAWTA